MVIELLSSLPCAIFATQHSPCTVSITQTGGSACNMYGIERNKEPKLRAEIKKVLPRYGLSWIQSPVCSPLHRRTVPVMINRR